MKLLLVLAIAACSRPAAPAPPSESAARVSSASCGAPCTVSQTCSDVFSSCRFCFAGQCSATLPAQPTTVDAGIDATP